MSRESDHHARMAIECMDLAAADEDTPLLMALAGLTHAVLALRDPEEFFPHAGNWLESASVTTTNARPEAKEREHGDD